MKPLLIVIALVSACSESKQPSPQPEAKTSHPAMPNQIEVGSTLAGKYRIVKKLGAVDGLDVLAAEHATMAEKSYVLVTPSAQAGSDAGAALNDAAKRQAARGVAGELTVDDVGTTPQGSVYVVLSATEDQVKGLLTGSVKLGG